jgi:hypothetical protein
MLTFPAKEEQEAAPAAAAAAVAAFLPKRDTFYDGLPNIDRVFELDHAGIHEAAFRELRCWLRFYGPLLTALLILNVKFDFTSTGDLVNVGIIVIIGVGVYAVLEFVLRSRPLPPGRVFASQNQHVALTPTGIRYDQNGKNHTVGLGTTTTFVRCSNLFCAFCAPLRCGMSACHTSRSHTFSTAPVNKKTDSLSSNQKHSMHE